MFVSATCTLGQQSKPLGAQLRVRWNGFNITVIEGGARHHISVDGKINAYALTSVKLLSAKAADGFVYLLFDVRGPSRGPEESEYYCGAGEERSLIWVQLDDEWDYYSSSSFAIESCWDNAELNDEGGGLKFDGPDLIARGTTFRDPATENTVKNFKLRRYEITYSLKHPESGLKISLVPQGDGVAK